MTYAEAVDKVAGLMLKRAYLERSGTFGRGWFEATSDLLRAIREANEAFPGDDYRIALDAFKLIGRRIK